MANLNQACCILNLQGNNWRNSPGVQSIFLDNFTPTAIASSVADMDFGSNIFSNPIGNRTGRGAFASGGRGCCQLRF